MLNGLQRNKDEVDFLHKQVELKHEFISQSFQDLKNLKAKHGKEYKNRISRKYIILDVLELRKGIKKDLYRIDTLYMYIDATEDFYADCM